VISDRHIERKREGRKGQSQSGNRLKRREEDIE
jgi:hypothetical protein